MEQDTIVQFECFETSIGLNEFVSQWERYAKTFAGKDADVTLHQQQGGTKSRFKYVSKHKWPEDSFRFVFMKGRHSENFPEYQVHVVQAGGYSPVQIECMHDSDADHVKIIFFITSSDADLTVYKKFQSYRFLNIYEAYYESCLYAYILEFFVEEADAHDLLKQVKVQTTAAEIGIYKECLVMEE